MIEKLTEKDFLMKGDKVRLTFSAGGLFKATKQALIRQRLTSIKEISVTEIAYTNTEMVVTARVVENPLPVAFLVGGIIAVAAGATVYLSLVKVERIIENPAGALAVGGFGAIFWSIAVGILVVVLSKKSFLKV